MCGFAGVYNISNTTKIFDEALLQRMHERLAHRGPDDAGTWLSEDKKLGFSHSRLTIIDTSCSGRQPMHDPEESLVLIFNGEIYNHSRLRLYLQTRGYKYRSYSDTETLLFAFKEWGIECLKNLDGMFAFAMFDRNAQELYLVRDRIGIKPLYFTIQDGTLSFASEIKALWELESNKKQLSQLALYHYLTFMVTPAPYTIYENVYKLPAGFYCKIDAQKNISFHEWYSPVKRKSVAEQKNFHDEYFCLESIKFLLEDATRKRMMSDVPFGAFLSGGLDSSLNVAFMSRYVKKVKTFTVSFSDGPEHNELRWARRVAKYYDTDHHEIVISEKEAFQFYEQMVYHLDEPLADCVCIPFYFVAKCARDAGVKVVQVGEGADELFFGYETYAHYKNMNDLVWTPTQSLVPKIIKRGIAGAIKQLFPERYRYQQMADSWASGKQLFWGGALAFSEPQKRYMLSTVAGEEDDIVKKIFSGMRQGYDSSSVVDYHCDQFIKRTESWDFCNRMLYLELKQRLPELLLMRADKMAMAAGIEARVPFLDYKLVEFMLQVPKRLKFKNNETKYLLKKAAEGILPNDIIYRKKVGFGAPTVRWFNRGKYFPSYFEKIRKKHDKGFGNLARGLESSPSVQAVQKWVLQNIWALPLK